MLCGLSSNLISPVGFLAVQGIGGGGLTVTAAALIDEDIPPRERGRYQGLLRAVFGVTAAAGPLLGGVVVHPWTSTPRGPVSACRCRS